MRKTILIVGGSSGVGLELARHYIDEGHRVGVTGRRDPELPGAQFFHLPIGASADALPLAIDDLISAFSGVQTLVYAAGFLQRGTIETLRDEALLTMTNVGLIAPMMLVSRLKPLAPTPLKLMLITSSSQYTPRAQEPAYTATKAGLGMLGASLARDAGIGKVLVAAPSGIRTAFWNGTDEDTTSMLDPVWVANQIVELSSGAFKYRYAKILRNPARVEIVETLDNSFAPVA
jgi:NAD(P)-dependent dehydrogenase (short-subunit alcohol dehydrogenase family)